MEQSENCSFGTIYELLLEYRDTVYHRFRALMINQQLPNWSSTIILFCLFVCWTNYRRNDQIDTILGNIYNIFDHRLPLISSPQVYIFLNMKLVVFLIGYCYSRPVTKHYPDFMCEVHSVNPRVLIIWSNREIVKVSMESLRDLIIFHWSIRGTRW